MPRPWARKWSSPLWRRRRSKAVASNAPMALGGRAMPVLDCPIPKEHWAQKVGERNGVSVPPAEEPAEKPVADAGPWEPTVQKIVELQQLGDDWDGFGARA